jgi:hypothetical protein
MKRLILLIAVLSSLFLLGCQTIEPEVEASSEEVELEEALDELEELEQLDQELEELNIDELDNLELE